MKTYLFLSKYYNEQFIDFIFSLNKNWKKASPDDKNIDFVYFDSYADFKNQVDISKIYSNIKYEFNDFNKNKIKITNKALLYDNFLIYNKEFTKKYFMPQYNLSKTNIEELKDIFDNGNIWILKPTFGYKGSDIKIFTNYDNFKKYYNTEAIQKLNKYKNSHKKNPLVKYDGWVLSKYVTKPHLFLKRKYHFRVYLFITFIEDELKGHLFNIFPMIIAKKDYKNGNYNNKNSHNTHWTDLRENVYLFPFDFITNFGYKKTVEVFYNIKNIVINIFHFIKDNLNFQCFPEAKNCFEIFGIDILLDENFELKILEINQNVSFQVLNDFSILAFGFIQSIIEITINKYYSEKYQIRLIKNLLSIVE